jgi:hypothetical protein
MYSVSRHLSLASLLLIFNVCAFVKLDITNSRKAGYNKKFLEAGYYKNFREAGPNENFVKPDIPKPHGHNKSFVKPDLTKNFVKMDITKIS